MSKKYVYEDIQNYLQTELNNKFELLSSKNEYQNCTTKLNFKCNSCNNIFTRSFSDLKRRNKCPKCEKNKRTNINIEMIKNEMIEKGCLCLSDSYINWKIPLKIQCICGRIFERSYNSFHSGSYYCPTCSRENFIKSITTDFQNILNQINQWGCEYISGDYKTRHSKLEIKCACGKIFKTSFYLLSQGNHCCKDCSNKLRSIQQTKSFSAILDIIHEFKCEYVSGNYVNQQSKILLRCSCGNLFEKTMFKFQQGQHQCPQCGYELHAKKVRKYDFGTFSATRLGQIIRKRLFSWRKKIMEIYHYQCPITGNTSNLEVHHLYGFSNILNDLYIMGIIKDDYEENLKKENLEKICNEVKARHSLNIGILISKDIHNHFHQIYGQGNNTPEQFDEFLNQFYHLRLSDIQIIPNIKAEQDNNIQIKIA